MAFKETKSKDKMRKRIFNFHLYPESVTCPYCFSEIDRNRLMFRKNEGEKKYDVILREYLYSVKSSAEVKESGKLINPENYPERNLIYDKNRVSGIVDYDSEFVSNAVCLFCHNRIRDFILDTPVKNIVLFSQSNSNRSENFFGKDHAGMLLVSRLRHSNRDIEFRRKLQMGENLLQYFAESIDKYDLIKNYIFTLWGDTLPGSDNFYIDRMKMRSVEKADACVVYLNTETSISQFLSDIISIYGGEDSYIKKPFAVCIGISSPDLKNADEFENLINEKYPEFFSQLYNYFEKYKVFAFSGGKLVSSENPVDWVFSNVRQ